MKAFQAHGPAGTRTAETPRAAAQAYFDAFPASRKCDVIEGEASENFFTVRYGRKSEGDWPQSYLNVTKKSAADLP